MRNNITSKTSATALSGITGTAFMTLLSYLLSVIAKEDFSEPEHLATMIRRLSSISKDKSRVAGWSAHFGIGLGFAAVYIELWEAGKIKPSVQNGLLLGLASGLLAVAVWKLTLKIHPLPPWINYNKFYLQLVPAHIVFALFATITYKLIQLQQQKD